METRPQQLLQAATQQREAMDPPKDYYGYTSITSQPNQAGKNPEYRSTLGSHSSYASQRSGTHSRRVSLSKQQEPYSSHQKTQ